MIEQHHSGIFNGDNATLTPETSGKVIGEILIRHSTKFADTLDFRSYHFPRNASHIIVS